MSFFSQMWSGCRHRGLDLSQPNLGPGPRMQAQKWEGWGGCLGDRVRVWKAGSSLCLLRTWRAQREPYTHRDGRPEGSIPESFRTTGVTGRPGSVSGKWGSRRRPALWWGLTTSDSSTSPMLSPGSGGRAWAQMDRRSGDWDSRPGSSLGPHFSQDPAPSLPRSTGTAWRGWNGPSGRLQEKTLLSPSWQSPCWYFFTQN